MLRAEAPLHLYDPTALRTARIGAIRPNPGFDRTPALAFAIRAGAAIEVPLMIAASSKNRSTGYRLSNVVAQLTVGRLAVDSEVSFFDEGKDFALAATRTRRSNIRCVGLGTKKAWNGVVSS